MANVVSSVNDLAKRSIERLKAFEPPDGYYLAFSGGKDSVLCKALMDIAGVKYDAHYRITTADPPELYNFIREVHPDVTREHAYYSDEFDREGKPVAEGQISMWEENE